MHLTELSKQPVHPQDINVYHIVAQVKVNQDVSFGFDNRQADFLLDREIERMNFTEIPAGTQLGEINNNISMPITAKNEKGQKVTENFFSIRDNSLHITKKIMPAMFTLDENVIRQDCLCYLMEKVEL